MKRWLIVAALGGCAFGFAAARTIENSAQAQQIAPSEAMRQAPAAASASALSWATGIRIPDQLKAASDQQIIGAMQLMSSAAADIRGGDRASAINKLQQAAQAEVIALPIYNGYRDRSMNENIQARDILLLRDGSAAPAHATKVARLAYDDAQHALRDSNNVVTEAQ